MTRTISEDLEHRAKNNPDGIFKVLVAVDFQRADENMEKLQTYVNDNKIKGRAGYLSTLELTGQQILYLKEQPYIEVISVPHPKVFRHS